MEHSNKKTSSAFTIVELLIVIVVIGILAAITIVAFNGIQDRARKAIIDTDLAGVQKSLIVYQVDNSGNYPATIAAANFKTSTNTALQYSVDNTVTPKTYCVTAINTGKAYYVSSTIAIPTSGACTGHSLPGAVSCAAGYIAVPGNSTFGTSDFCVMKYEAKNSSGSAVSEAAGLPWGSISQTSAISTATSTCSGCHLITEMEWMTIANNVLGVASNWTGGSVGTGMIYRGHSDSAPYSRIAADASDANGYANTGDTTGNQRRTLTLSNGEVIWDLSGNAYEWTSGTVAANTHPGLTSDFSMGWKEYTEPSLIWRGLAANTRPVNVFSGAATWDSSKGIGALNSNYGDTALKAVFRGGSYASIQYAGVLSVSLGSFPSTTSADIGFRITRAPN